MHPPPFEQRVRRAFSEGRWAVPLTGHGRTAERHRRLAELARGDLSEARIAEAHTDAIAILAEAGHATRPGVLYGVWASDGPNSRVHARRAGRGAWHLEGTKQYCSGAPFLDAALVTAHASDSVLLFDVPLATGVKIEPSTWSTPALAETATVPVTFDVTLADAAVVGAPDWYLARPGFWHGAVGPAACWAGGALSLIDAVRALDRQGPHAKAQLGALEALAWNLQTILDQAGGEIDADPDDETHRAKCRALICRHLIERQATEVMDRFGRASGPQLLAFDEFAARQYAGLSVYIRQCHAEKDDEAIATSIPRAAIRGAAASEALSV
jgi:alkylation response protein AidB-like acyl-CoA dehydrogenase